MQGTSSISARIVSVLDLIFLFIYLYTYLFVLTRVWTLKAVKGFKFYLIPLFGFSIQETDLDLYCCVGVYIIASLI